MSTQQNDPVAQATGAATATTQKTRTRCEVWTRVMGYHRPVQNFNIGKKSEHYSRAHFQEAKTLGSAMA